VGRLGTSHGADALARAAALGGLEIPDATTYEVTGAEPVLASPHRLATGAATARLLTGVAANELWRRRTGRRQHLGVDLAHAGAALVSFAHLRVLDPSRALPVDLGRPGALALTRILATADGRHIQLHASFNDTAAILEELSLSADPEPDAIAAAVARRGADELEAALVRRGVCGGVVRTRAEWAAHPQGAALAGRPLVTLTRLGDAPRRPLPDGPRPASGIRVLDLTRVLAGPTCAKSLAEHGADVLHVTNPRSATIPVFDLDTGFGKRQAALDLDVPAHARALAELIDGADVFSQGYRLGAMARRGLDPAALAARRPGIVYVSENCYGALGPWATRPGWEQLAQAATGMSHREGQASPDGVPRLAPAAASDYATGWLAAYGAMMALARRADEGGSWLVECSLSQTASWYQAIGDDLDPAAAAPGDTRGLLDEVDTEHYGRVRYLRPALSMSETSPGFELPPAPDGAHEPSWLTRS
jgi:crotonobetainyl-CoA:carnitine CoA-transferase CaiB-like acyl-CoA transferase